MLQIMTQDFRTLLRDRGNLFFTLLFPTLMVFLLGNLLANMDDADAAIGTLTIQYAIETEDPLALASIMPFLSELSNSDEFRVARAQDIEAAKALAARDAITAAVRFTQPLAVHLYTGSDGTKNRAVASVFSVFSQQSGVMYALMEAAPQNLLGASMGDGEALVQQKDLGVSRSMLDYYAITQTIMILLMGGVVNASSIQEDRRTGRIEGRGHWLA
jgi:ABC-2 type transport system permease protein